MNFIQVKAKYCKVDEVSGKEKMVTVPYLIDAMSVTEAEARALKELEQMVSGDITIKSADQSNITEFFPNENGDRYFKAKVVFVDVDEASGKEKRTANYMLVQANNVKHAYEFLEEDCLKDMLVPFEIPAISESPIENVFQYFPVEEAPEGFKKVVDAWQEIPIESREVDNTLEFDFACQNNCLIRFKDGQELRYNECTLPLVNATHYMP